jgi:hypothetical protein
VIVIQVEICVKIGNKFPFFRPKRQMMFHNLIQSLELFREESWTTARTSSTTTHDQQQQLEGHGQGHNQGHNQGHDLVAHYCRYFTDFWITLLETAFFQ